MNYRAIEVYKEMARASGARLRCLEQQERDHSKHEWVLKHEETIESLIEDFLPSGSGIDNGVQFDFDASTGEKLVFNFSFHHMNENGFYCGWTDYTLTVRPSLELDINLKISGRDFNDVKSYLYDIFNDALTTVIVWNPEKNGYVEDREGEAK